MSKKIIFLMLILALLMTACGGSEDDKAENTPVADDKLAEIMGRGTLVIATDPAYPPQSQIIEGAERSADTKCAPDQSTVSQVEGFDVEVAKEISKRLGVEPCFVFPTWTLVVSGSWADRWDISVGSMTITPERLNLMYFPQPYYITPAAFFVHTDNTTYTEPADLNGTTIGVCAGCTYEAYLNKVLEIPGQEIEFMVDDAAIIGYEVDNAAIEDLAQGDGTVLDAVLMAIPTGLAAIEAGTPIKQIEGTAFNEYLAIAIDRKMSKDPVSLHHRISEIIQSMHTDGTLSRLSEEYYGQDYTAAASTFDLAALGQ